MSADLGRARTSRDVSLFMLACSRDRLKCTYPSARFALEGARDATLYEIDISRYFRIRVHISAIQCCATTIVLDQTE